jgi:hypothetical protein
MLKHSNNNAVSSSIKARNLILIAIATSTALVVFGAILYSTVGISFTQLWRDIVAIAPSVKGMLIGLILGDFYISRRGKGASLSGSFSMKSFSFVWHLFTRLSHYCQSWPYVYSALLNGKVYNCIKFSTRNYKCFVELYNLFYVNGVKVVPSSIAQLLTAECLAYWAICDGGKANRGFNLNTHSFTYEECLLLVSALKERFDLDCSLHANKGHHRIYIKAGSIEKFRALVTPYFHPSMLYKLR